MNIVGLNKLGLAPQAPKSQGKASPKDTPSFEETLGQAKADSKPDPKPVAKRQDARVQEIEPQALPSQPVSPILDSPALGDRYMPGPNELPTVNPLNKPQIGAVKGEDQVDSLTRRAVWSDFLRKMKDELGVSAEDVLGAFDSLSAEDLAKPPAETVDKVVMALGLNDNQSQMAKQFFLDLIHRTQPKSLGEELAKSEKQISLTLMSQREVDRKSTGKAIDNLNQNFFMKGPYERPLAPQQLPPQTAAPQMQTQDLYQAEDKKKEIPMLPPTFTASRDPATRAAQMQAIQFQGASFNGGSEIPKELQQATDQPAKADVDSLLKKFTEGQGQSAQMLAAGKESFAPAAMMAPAAPVVETAASKAAGSANAQAMAAMQAIFNGGSSSAQSQAEFGDEREFTSDASYLGATAGADGQSRVQNGQPSEFQAQLNTVAPGPVAVPDLVKNAQVMVRDGGGEMKVTLTPEGLGEVAMKVSVKDGKVNVQMITESDEAKRMIERTLGDLKTSLASSNLQVNDIKIDTASNLGKQLEQQFSDAQRQQAHQTLEQFRQDHQGWRRSFFEVPGAKAYRGQAEAPRDVQAPTTASAKRGSSRLNLVA